MGFMVLLRLRTTSTTGALQAAMKMEQQVLRLENKFEEAERRHQYQKDEWAKQVAALEKEKYVSVHMLPGHRVRACGRACARVSLKDPHGACYFRGKVPWQSAG